MYTFDKRLRQLRTERNLTQKQLAIEIGFGERSIQNYELGERKPEHDAIIKLCQYFQVSADYLLGLSDEPVLRNDYITINLDLGITEERPKPIRRRERKAQ